MSNITPTKIKGFMQFPTRLANGTTIANEEGGPAFLAANVVDEIVPNEGALAGIKIIVKHTTDQPIYRSLYALEYLRHKVVVELSHPIVSRLSASWALRWQQRMNGYKPYAKLDGKLTWREPRWQIYLKADNLTCHRYYDLGSVKQPGLWIMAGAGITL